MPTPRRPPRLLLLLSPPAPRHRSYRRCRDCCSLCRRRAKRALILGPRVADCTLIRRPFSTLASSPRTWLGINGCLSVFLLDTEQEAPAAAHLRS
eukprot:4076332-Pleurochrysis_carterae.AAC.1